MYYSGSPLVCPWTLVRSWEHLSSSSLFPLSLFSPSFPFSPSCLGVPGCFRRSWESFFPLGVSLDACVVAGNTFFSFPLFFGVFLNAMLRFPPFSLVCPWTLVRSWEHLSSSSLFPLSLFSFFPFPPSCLGVPGCFRHSWEPFFSLGVSLDACVVAGNTFFSFPFFFFFLLFSPYPSCRDLRVGR